MIIFSLPDYRYSLSYFNKERGFRSGKYHAVRFENGTLLISITTVVRGKICVVIGGSVPDENLVETFLLIHTLKKEGAKKITLVAPFIPYSRQDKNVAGESWGMKWLSGVSDASGVDRIVTVDVHSPFFTRSVTPLVSLSSAGILAEAVRKRISPGFVCVAPDEGAVDNCLAINNALKNTEAIAFFVKKRSRLGVKLLSLKGKVGDEVLLVDDILDTGETLLAACRKLRDRGVKRITIAVTH